MNVTTAVFVGISVLAACGAWWWFVARNVPKYPPIWVAEDDPAMIAAIKQARSSFDRFRSLYQRGLNEAQVKIPFKTSSGETEHIWAEVLSLNINTVSVRYLTPPVTHTGELERLYEHPISLVEDWVAIENDGRIHGGYTQRVVFERGRQEWGSLPPELEKQASRFVSE